MEKSLGFNRRLFNVNMSNDIEYKDVGVLQSGNQCFGKGLSPLGGGLGRWG